jgi:hypothetical protein
MQGLMAQDACRHLSLLGTPLLPTPPMSGLCLPAADPAAALQAGKYSLQLPGRLDCGTQRGECAAAVAAVAPSQASARRAAALPASSACLHSC